MSGTPRPGEGDPEKSPDPEGPHQPTRNPDLPVHPTNPDDAREPRNPDYRQQATDPDDLRPPRRPGDRAPTDLG